MIVMEQSTNNITKHYFHGTIQTHIINHDCHGTIHNNIAACKIILCYVFVDCSMKTYSDSISYDMQSVHIWIYGYMDTWIYGYMGPIWTPGFRTLSKS